MKSFVRDLNKAGRFYSLKPRHVDLPVPLVYSDAMEALQVAKRLAMSTGHGVDVVAGDIAVDGDGDLQATAWQWTNV